MKASITVKTPKIFGYFMLLASMCFAYIWVTAIQSAPKNDPSFNNIAPVLLMFGLAICAYIAWYSVKIIIGKPVGSIEVKTKK